MAWKVFTYSTVISESGLDSFGHLNNAAYLRYFEDARWRLMHESDYTRKKILESRQGPVILEVNLRFRRELMGGEMVTIETQVQSYEGKIARLIQQMKFEDGRVAADAVFTIGYFDLEKRRLIDPSPEWLKVLGSPL